MGQQKKYSRLSGEKKKKEKKDLFLALCQHEPLIQNKISCQCLSLLI